MDDIDRVYYRLKRESLGSIISKLYDARLVSLSDEKPYVRLSTSEEARDVCNRAGWDVINLANAINLADCVITESHGHVNYELILKETDVK